MGGAPWAWSYLEPEICLVLLLNGLDRWVAASCKTKALPRQNSLEDHAINLRKMSPIYASVAGSIMLDIGLPDVSTDRYLQ